MSEMVLLGDEAVAIGAVHAGISAAYAYPGTPSTEITEFLIGYAEEDEGLRAAWSSNEKTAFRGFEDIEATLIASTTDGPVPEFVPVRIRFDQPKLLTMLWP